MLSHKQREYLASYSKIIGDAFQTNARALAKFAGGLELYNQDKVQKAIKVFENVLKMCKTDAELAVTYAFLGICYEETIFPNLAKEAYQKSIAYNGKISTVWSNLGLLYKNEGFFAKAIECFQKAIAVDENNAYPHYNLGALYYRLAENDQALACCLKALDIQPNLFQAAEIVCCIYFILQNTELYHKYYQRAVTNGGTKERMDHILAEHRKRDL